MVLYDFYCPECGKERVVKNPIDEDFPPLSCDRCSVALKQRLPFLKPLTHNTGSTIAERIREEAAYDVQQIKRGNEKKMSEIIGNKVNPLKK